MARMQRRVKRKIFLVTVLVTLLALLVVLFINYRATKKIGFDIAIDSGDILTPPQFLYSFSGSPPLTLQRPLGVLADGDRIFVTDSRQGLVLQYRPDGTYVKSFGKGRLLTPLYIVKNPRNGNLYVSDRRTRAIEIFDTTGKYVGAFDPKLPKNQLPKFKTNDQWAPVAMAFAPDGTLYVTEILNGHRLLVFGPDGKFKKSVGTAGLVTIADKAPEIFQFPNSVKVLGKEVWVSDSNNRRLQVFDLSGNFVRIVATAGLPRGFDFLPPRPGAKKNAPALLAVVDTLAHDTTIWDVKGKKILGFGQQGVLGGQFSYPNDLSVGAKSAMFIADTNNGRIQVWGWPDQVAPISLPKIPQQWGWCLTPLLLLPLLLLARKKKFVATPDFVHAMIAAETADAMVAPRRTWLVTQAAYEELKDLRYGEIVFAELLEPIEHSDSDVRALIERLELEHDAAVTLSIAQRAKVFCTEDAELRRLAKVLELDVYDSEEFLQAFTKREKAAESSE